MKVAGGINKGRSAWIIPVAPRENKRPALTWVSAQEPPDTLLTLEVEDSPFVLCQATELVATC